MSETDKVVAEPETAEADSEPNKESEETVESLRLALQKEKEDKKGMESQIIELRKKLQEEKVSKSAKTEEPPKGDDLESKVMSVLFAEKKKEAETNRKKALSSFWEKHPEFNPANDSTGLRGEALMRSLSRLNTANSFTVEDATQDLEDALRLLKREENKSTDVDTASFASSPNASGSPKSSKSAKLTPEQEKLRKEKGWTEEKYLQMKAKYPNVIL